MRIIAYLVGAGVFSLGSVASAQDVPKERVGFQMALRTGYAVPLGDAQENVEMSDVASGQVPLFVEIGGKVSPNVFLGGYLGLSFGGPDGALEAICDPWDACVSVGMRLGAEVQYHILPRGSANPWIGYGIGLEALAVGFEEDDDEGSVAYDGFEYARLSAGVDFRLSRVFGLGPFLDFSVGEYTGYEVDIPGVSDDEGDIENGAAHQWLTFGVRGVFFP